MNFKEASKMKEGTKFTLEEYSHKGYLVFHFGNIFDGKGNQQYANVNLFESNWEIVEEDEDWNLMSTRGGLANNGNIEKCKDLILKDLELFKEKTLKKSFANADNIPLMKDTIRNVFFIVNKRFGDL